MSIGFLPRDTLTTSGTNFLANDDQRLDGKDDCTCFSVEFPNCHLFGTFRNKYPGSKWAVIELDANLLVQHMDRVYYCYDNAARNDIRAQLLRSQLCNVRAFEKMFQEKYSYIRASGSGTVIRSNISGIKSYLPTSVQAEILIAGFIPRRFIKAVYFQTEEDCNEFRHGLSSEINIPEFSFNVNLAYFVDRGRVNFPERMNV